MDARLLLSKDLSHEEQVCGCGHCIWTPIRRTSQFNLCRIIVLCSCSKESRPKYNKAKIIIILCPALRPGIGLSFWWRWQFKIFFCFAKSFFTLLHRMTQQIQKKRRFVLITHVKSSFFIGREKRILSNRQGLKSNKMPLVAKHPRQNKLK